MKTTSDTPDFQDDEWCMDLDDKCTRRRFRRRKSEIDNDLAHITYDDDGNPVSHYIPEYLL